MPAWLCLPVDLLAAPKNTELVDPCGLNFIFFLVALMLHGLRGEFSMTSITDEKAGQQSCHHPPHRGHGISQPGAPAQDAGARSGCNGAEQRAGAAVVCLWEA